MHPVRKTIYTYKPASVYIVPHHQRGPATRYLKRKLESVEHEWRLSSVDEAKAKLQTFNQALAKTAPQPPVMDIISTNPTDSSGEFAESRTQQRLSAELQKTQADLDKARKASQSYTKPVKENPSRMVVDDLPGHHSSISPCRNVPLWTHQHDTHKGCSSAYKFHATVSQLEGQAATRDTATSLL